MINLLIWSFSPNISISRGKQIPDKMTVSTSFIRAICCRFFLCIRARSQRGPKARAESSVS